MKRNKAIKNIDTGEEADTLNNEFPKNETHAKITPLKQDQQQHKH